MVPSILMKCGSSTQSHCLVMRSRYHSSLVQSSSKNVSIEAFWKHRIQSETGILWSMLVCLGIEKRFHVLGTHALHFGIVAGPSIKGMAVWKVPQMHLPPSWICTEFQDISRRCDGERVWWFNQIPSSSALKPDRNLISCVCLGYMNIYMI